MTEVKEDAGQVGGLTPVKEGVGFSPWPWVVDDAAEHPSTVRDATGLPVIEAWIGAHRNWRANRNLAAAAPVLYEALEHAASVLAMLTEPEAIRSTSVQTVYAHAVVAGVKIRTALSQARGEAPSKE